jgi:hypothetical protein
VRQAAARIWALIQALKACIHDDDLCGKACIGLDASQALPACDANKVLTTRSAESMQASIPSGIICIFTSLPISCKANSGPACHSAPACLWLAWYFQLPDRTLDTGAL